MATAFPIDTIAFKNIKFHEKLGEGAFGSVHRVTFSGFLISNQFNGYKQAAAKTVFKLEEREIQVMSQLHHNNIVKLVGFSEAGPIHVILMEYAPNGSLHDYLSDPSKPLTNELKRKWIKESALAIQYLHRHDFLHRDIKGSNCILFEDNLLKITDFGLARKIDHSQTTSSQKGTNRYMAPEIHRGNEHSKPADIYAYGMLTLEICTRNEPFEGTEWQTVVFEVGSGRLKPSVPEYCPRDLADIMLQCWNYDPKQRPTIGSIVQALCTWSLEREIKPPHRAHRIACSPHNGDLVTYGRNRINIHDSDGKYKMSFTPTEQDSNKPIRVIDICVSPQGDILVVGAKSKFIHVFDKQGKYLHCFNTLTQGEDENTHSIAMDREGNVLVGDSTRDIITIHTYPDGSVVKKIKCSIAIDRSMVVNNKNQILIHSDTSGSVYSKVAAIDYLGNEVFSFTPKIDEDVTGTVVWPHGIVCDDEDNIYVAMMVSMEENTGHIHAYSPTGTFLQCIAKGLYNPRDLSMTPDGSLVLANQTTILIYSLQ
ncbi:uncharacterized protein [Amphiura filiformis]|uniref:uncharacterized protein n=1 Tax=Amphiura filiformis TaxID=82378 RepID=UPI003B21FDF0